MATARTQQTHTERVQQIAEEAAANVAADSPLEEDVFVTIEELPPTATRRHDELTTAAEPLPDSWFMPTRYIETLGALGAANAACVQGIVGAQLRFAGRLAGIVSPRTR
jgi:hypothetical protein